MTTATREILVGQGHDPRDFALMSYGGGGGIFAAGIAGDLSISRVIIPPNPGVLSAWGMLSMDVAHGFAQTFAWPIDGLDVRELNSIFQNMEARGLVMLRDDHVPDEAMEFRRSLDMCYQGQGHYVEVPVPGGELGQNSLAEISERFHGLHQIRYGHRMERIPKTISVRVKAIGKIKKRLPQEYPAARTIPDAAFKPERTVYFEGASASWKVVERDRLLTGNSLGGPAIVEEPYHTTVVWPKQNVSVDRYGNLIIET
jgi:N-methylhydantoinase A